MRTMSAVPAAMAFLFVASARFAPGATVTVNDAGDSSNACATTGTGTCTLRDAITYANAHTGSTVIFNIAGSGVHTITPSTVLPAITVPVTIDGYTQPGASPNTLAAGDNAVLLIELSGASGSPDGLDLGTGSDSSVVRGLVLNHWSGASILLYNSGSHTIAGNFVGTDPTGSVAEPNGGGATGVSLALAAASNVTVGGVDPADRNLISGNGSAGVTTDFGTGNVIQGNLIGTDATGTAAIPNGTGIYITGNNQTIGGTAAGAGNVISANASDGIDLQSANGSTIEGNLIGTDVTGTIALGNHGVGLGIAGSSGVTVGGTAAGEGNVIAFNNGASSSGVVVYSGTGNPIRGNSIHDNTQTGIDLGNDGVTPNDLGDADTGPNDLQNFPVLRSVTYGAANTTVAGLLNSTASTTFDIDFYADPPCSNFPRDFLQGQTYLGTSQVTTDGSGNAPFTVSTLPPVASGSRISMTATDPSGNTSEFSQRLPFSVNIKSGPPAGGTALTISGTNFLANATVTVGGVAATGVVVNSYTSLSATTPPLAAGTANDIVITNTDTTTGTLVKGFIADFLDVPPTQLFYAYVTTLVSNAVTAGLGDGTYGVNDDTERQQMAVFILKAKHGLCFVPPTCTGIFQDVPCPSQFANWIEELANEHITSGCDATHFCPSDNVRRDQMAVFLLKAKHGSTYVPPTCTGIFLDVPCPSQFANWIEELFHESITGGCDATHYCPADPSTRGQMAVFIVKTFNLQ
jgi:CSLREA domain-containing protein